MESEGWKGPGAGRLPSAVPGDHHPHPCPRALARPPLSALPLASPFPPGTLPTPRSLVGLNFLSLCLVPQSLCSEACAPLSFEFLHHSVCPTVAIGSQLVCIYYVVCPRREGAPLIFIILLPTMWRKRSMTDTNSLGKMIPQYLL